MLHTWMFLFLYVLPAIKSRLVADVNQKITLLIYTNIDRVSLFQAGRADATRADNLFLQPGSTPTQDRLSLLFCCNKANYITLQG